jgi:Tol biopolymer transport system component
MGCLWWDIPFLPTWTQPRAEINAVPLTTYPELEGRASLSPDGGRVVFVRGNSWYMGNIRIQQIGVQEAEPLPLTSLGRDFSLAWSPDDRQIAFMRSVGPMKSALMSMPSLNGSERLLVEVQHTAEWDGPLLAWSPDSRWLVFSGYPAPDEGAGLFAYSLESRQMQRITRIAAPYRRDHSPAFSPGGRTLQR